MVFLWIIMSFSFPFSFLGSVIKVFRDHVKIIALFWRDTTTTITLLLIAPSITSTATTLLLFSPSCHHISIVFPLPHCHHISIVFPLHHLHRHRISIREIKTSTAWMYSSAVWRDSSAKKEVTGAPCTVYYFPRIPLKLRPWRFFFLPHPL